MSAPFFFFLLLSLMAARGWAVTMESGFSQPPEQVRPWVYWYFMDGNRTREGLTADLEAMRAAGIGGAIFLEVNTHIPRGPIAFMSPDWVTLFAHAIREAKRCGIKIAMGSGPGWCGTGGPWIKPEDSMQHITASETTVTGPGKFDAILPRPPPHRPFFGKETLSPQLAAQWEATYRDVAVVAFPKLHGNQKLPEWEEKTLVYRAPYTSLPGVKSSLPMPVEHATWPLEEVISPKSVVDLTAQMSADGKLRWNIPKGDWTILRFVQTPTGQTTRPAPEPGLGFETDKFSRAATEIHIRSFLDPLWQASGGTAAGEGGGWAALHFDSWEMGAQNWSGNFREQFKKMRGYDLLPFLPAYLGRAVESVEKSERFLWDVRLTAQELIFSNSIVPLRAWAHEKGLEFTSEFYDLNPTSDLSLGALADVPMGEFWWLGFGGDFDGSFSVIEAAAIAHTNGREVVAAEAFTSNPGEDWRAYPGNMKNLADWALAAGVNRFAIHRLQHQPCLDRFPGMGMWLWGVHWDRTQTWWNMSLAFHNYLSRCQFLLRQGQSVADILFLAPEGAPHVFRPPPSATLGSPPDRRAYNFDGCAPDTFLERAQVKDRKILFPGGTTYEMLVLPEVPTMSLPLLRKIQEFAEAGVRIVGPPPQKSPGLSGFPNSDDEVRKLAKRLWDKGQVKWGPAFTSEASSSRAAPHPLDNASWVWTSEFDKTNLHAPVGVRTFKVLLKVPDSPQGVTGKLFITADDTFVAQCNGKEVGRGDKWSSLYEFNLAGILRGGENELVVQASNGGPDPAGLIAAVQISTGKGTDLHWQTDTTWTCSSTPTGVFEPVTVVVPFGGGPWGRPGRLEQLVTVTYPHFTALTQFLESENVKPDFETEGPIRYTHRRTDEADLYFVANRTEVPIEAQGHFRVVNRQPELWHPVTGDRRLLPDFTAEAGRTSVPLRFASGESYFVVFRQPGRSKSSGEKNFAVEKEVLPLSGSWAVSFDPKWGGPEKVTFDKLEDWSKSADEGIKYYSGQATYRQDFDFAGKIEPEQSGSDYYLGLGAVKNMARVRLNGQDLGVVWCAPWQVKVTGALRSGKNDLEITVANLWVNRLIGDAGLPESQKKTWTTENPLKRDSAMEPSGLLGPVVLFQSPTPIGK
jgi:hypothetical protein